MRYLHLLPFRTMLSLSEHWLNDDTFVASLEAAGPLGVGLYHDLIEAHDPLAELERVRTQARAALRSLIDQATRLDLRHDRLARSLHLHLRALIEGAQSEEDRRRYEGFEALLLPEGLSVVQLPYLDEGGAALARERSVSAEVRAQLASITVGPRSLDQLYMEWNAAATQLSSVVVRRTEVAASLGQEGGGEIDLRAARARWLNAVRGLLWALERPKLAGLRERVHAALKHAIDQRLVSVEQSPEMDEGLEPEPADELDELEPADELDELDELEPVDELAS